MWMVRKKQGDQRLMARTHCSKSAMGTKLYDVYLLVTTVLSEYCFEEKAKTVAQVRGSVPLVASG
jgi:hypothetical protein